MKRKSLGRWPSKGTMWNKGTKIRNKGQLIGRPLGTPIVWFGKLIMSMGEKEYNG